MKTLSFFVKKLSFGIIWLLLGIGLFSCEPDPIEIELPPHEQKLVIATQVFPEKYMVVQVSKSFSSLAGPGDSIASDTTLLKELLVEHALVQVSYNGRTETLKHLGKGLYYSSRIRQNFRQTYTLFVKDSVSGLECTAATEMLAPIAFDKIEPKVTRTAKDTTIALHYELTDPGAERNFFLITLVGASRKNVIPWKGSRSLQQIQEQMILLNDEQFTNGRFSKTENLDLETSDTMVVAISNISEPYYRYLELYQKSNGIINQLTGEPINLPTNIQNGYGFFNAHNPTAQVFKISEW
jgi:hypothetical protein